jgi:hypothetical protein
MAYECASLVGEEKWNENIILCRMLGEKLKAIKADSRETRVITQAPLVKMLTLDGAHCLLLARRSLPPSTQFISALMCSNSTRRGKSEQFKKHRAHLLSSPRPCFNEASDVFS